VSIRLLVETILSQKTFAVTGVSRNKDKYGYKVYNSLRAAGYRVFPINPNADTIDGDTCYPSLDNVPVPIDVVVTVTPPQITEETMYLAGRLKIPFVWMQPGAESTAAINDARAYSLQVVAGGPCIMVAVRQKMVKNLL
jgi:predicted CoA-binding protein